MSVLASGNSICARWFGVLALATAALGCGDHDDPPPPKPVPTAEACSFSLADVTRDNAKTGLRVNEVMTANDGAWVDEAGETDDFIELINTTDASIALGDYSVGDKPGKATRLPRGVLAAFTS